MQFSRLKKALKPIISNFNGTSTKNKFITISDEDEDCENELPLYLSNFIIDTYKSDLQPILEPRGSIIASKTTTLEAMDFRAWHSQWEADS